MPNSRQAPITNSAAQGNENHSLDTAADPNNVRPAIIAAATDCFARYGVKKTTVDDISKAAGVSRPTFYRFYKNKQGLLLSLAIEEMRRISNKSHKLQKKFDQIDDVFIEAILDAVIESQKSQIVQFLLSPENEDLIIQITESAEEAWQLQTSGWGRLLDRAEKEGRLRSNVKHNDIAHWITVIQTMFIIRSRAIKQSRAELRELIQSFVLPSILKDK